MAESLETFLCRTAVARGLLTPAQVEAARRAQADATPALPLEVVLVSLGFLSGGQVADLLADWSCHGTVLADPAARAASARTTGDPTLLHGDTTSPPTLPAAAETGEPRAGRGSAAPRICADGRRRFGKYELVQELGRGGMGVVYKAWRPDLQAHFAVKVLLAGEDASADDLDRFRREAQAAARLRHPGIVSVHDIGVEEGKTFFAMEYIEGRSLAQVLDDPAAAGIAPAVCKVPGADRRTGISAAMAVRWVREIAEALQHAHEAGVVHRDLKPGNVVRDRAGRLKVMDFGLAKLRDAGPAGATRTGTLMGTPAYMSPEQAAGLTREIDARSDVYQLGTILYELLTGRPPYDGGTAMDIVFKVLHEDPIAPRKLNPLIDRDAETICLKAMARERAKRYASAGALAEDCGRCLAGESILARREAGWERLARWARRRKAVVASLAAVLVALAGAGALGWRARVAEAEKAALRVEFLATLREQAELCTHAALAVRRSGGSLRKDQETYLDPLRKAAARVVTLDRSLPEPHYHLGRMYRALMWFSRALAEQELALQQDPGYAPSLYERAVLAEHDFILRLDALSAQSQSEVSGIIDQVGDAGSGASPLATVLLTNKRPEERDPEACALRDRLRADLARLEQSVAAPGADRAGAAAGNWGARLACARGLALAHGSRRAEDLQKARELLAAAIQQDPTLDEAYEAWAHVELIAGQFGKAVDVYGRGLQVDKGFVPFWMGRGSARNALTPFARMIGVDEDTLLTLAVGDFTRAVELDPEFTEAWLGRGRNRRVLADRLRWRNKDSTGLYRDAISDYGKVLDLDSQSTRAWQGRALCRTELALVQQTGGGADAEALYRAGMEDFARALALAPRATGIWQQRGWKHQQWARVVEQQGGDPHPLLAAAEADLTQAVSVDPAADDAWRSRGALRKQIGQLYVTRGEDPVPLFQGAFADFVKGGELAPRSQDAATEASRVLTLWVDYAVSRRQDPEPLYRNAVADLGRSLTAAPGSAPLRCVRGAAGVRLADCIARRGADPVSCWREAIADLDAVLEQDPRDFTARIARGEARLAWAYQPGACGDDPRPLLQGALQDFARAAELRPASSGARYGRGACRVGLGKDKVRRGEDAQALLRDARTDLDEAIRQRPRLACAHAARGQLNLLEGRWAEAVTDLGKALALDPKVGMQAKENLAEARARKEADADAGHERDR